MSKSPLEWDETYIRSLIGNPEDYKLEFKGIDLLIDPRTNKPKDNNQIAINLTKEVSAFANAEGGTIIIGMSEDNSKKPAVANNLDGVDDTVMDTERLQRIVEHSLSPHLPGITFRAIPLAGTAPVRNAFLIIVPKGSNAYQAKSGIYYIRSQFECNTLHDTQIRLLMSKGRTTQGTMVLQHQHTQMAETIYQRQVNSIRSQFINDYRRDISPSVRQEMERKITESQSRVVREQYDEYQFGLGLKNVGELTIKECSLTIEFLFKEQNVPHGQPVAHAQKHEGQTKSGFTKDNFIFSSQESVFKNRNSTTFVPEKKIYPGISVGFPEQVGFIIKIPAGKTLAEFGSKLKWTLYYDNFPSNSGEINLSDEFKGI